MSLIDEQLLDFKGVYHISEERKFVLAIMREKQYLDYVNVKLCMTGEGKAPCIIYPLNMHQLCLISHSNNLMMHSKSTIDSVI